MLIQQYRVHSDVPGGGASTAPAPLGRAQLVLAFGPSRGAPAGAPPAAWFEALAERYPDAARIYCSTAGHLMDVDVCADGEVSVTAVEFAHTRVRAVALPAPADGSDGHARALGEQLVGALPREGLRHVLVFADGVRVVASGFVAGITAALPPGVRVTGGMAGDDDRFGETLVGLGGAPEPGTVVAVGLYGDRLAVGAGACGGWTLFGPDREVTRAEGNVLYELDGEPALALYKRYLGSFADQLPESGLLFPLALRTRDGDTGVVRTVFGVDEESQSVRFAGDVPVGMLARLMKSSAERIIDGAGSAADLAVELTARELTARELTASARAESDGAGGATLALLVSCAGRRWVLGQRTEEELEAVRAALGEDATLAGFYSYGEIAPLGRSGVAALHNQTMTVTVLREA